MHGTNIGYSVAIKCSSHSQGVVPEEYKKGRAKKKSMIQRERKKSTNFIYFLLNIAVLFLWLYIISHVSTQNIRVEASILHIYKTDMKSLTCNYNP